MRRDTFLKSLAAMAAAGSFPLSALAAANLKICLLYTSPSPRD